MMVLVIIIKTPYELIKCQNYWHRKMFCMLHFGPCTVFLFNVQFNSTICAVSYWILVIYSLIALSDTIIQLNTTCMMTSNSRILIFNDPPCSGAACKCTLKVLSQSFHHHKRYIFHISHVDALLNLLSNEYKHMVLIQCLLC